MFSDRYLQSHLIYCWTTRWQMVGRWRIELMPVREHVYSVPCWPLQTLNHSSRKIEFSLSYKKILNKIWWEVLDSNQRSPKACDLQSREIAATRTSQNEFWFVSYFSNKQNPKQKLGAVEKNWTSVHPIPKGCNATILQQQKQGRFY